MSNVKLTNLQNAKKLHDNNYTKELSLACCDNVGRSNLIGMFVNMDETAPAAGDFSVMFFVKTAAEEFVDALVSNAFHLPSVEQYPEQMGIAAADLLLDLVEGIVPDTVPCHRIVKTDLVNLEYIPQRREA